MSWLFALFALLLCACTDYAQKIKDEFDPDDASMAENELKEISYGYMIGQLRLQARNGWRKT